jgi:hypothetical protein
MAVGAPVEYYRRDVFGESYARGVVSLQDHTRSRSQHYEQNDE